MFSIESWDGKVLNLRCNAIIVYFEESGEANRYKPRMAAVSEAEIAQRLLQSVNSIESGFRRISSRPRCFPTDGGSFATFPEEWAANRVLPQPIHVNTHAAGIAIDRVSASSSFRAGGVAAPALDWASASRPSTTSCVCVHLISVFLT